MTTLEQLGRDYCINFNHEGIHMLPSFQIDTPTPAILKSKTARDEKHGSEEAPAISLGWRLRVPNTWLDMLSPGLSDVFYEPGPAGAQVEIAEAQVVTLTKLRNAAIGPLEVRNAYTSCTLGVNFNGKPLLFGGCKVDKFVVNEMMEGGTVEIDLRIGTSDISAATAGKLVMMTAGSKHEITLAVPEQEDDKPAAQASIADTGSAAAPVESQTTPIEALAKADKAAKAKRPPKPVKIIGPTPAKTAAGKGAAA